MIDKAESYYTVVRKTVTTTVRNAAQAVPELVDANHDGVADLLVFGAYYPFLGNTPAAQPAILLLGNGDGTYAPAPGLLPAGFGTVHPREVVQADFNEDGQPDLFIADHGYDASPFPGAQNRLLLSQAGGGYTDGSARLPQVADFSHSTTAADINGDGHLDLFVGNMSGGGSPTEAYVLFGDGKGGFTRAEAGLPVPKEPVVFTKAISCLQGPNDPVMLPKGSKKTDWEVELGVVIGKQARHVSQKEALNHVAGYVLVNDVSEREFQIERGGTWDKGKGCDTFGPVGPWLVTRDEVPNPQRLELWLDLNGQRMQSGSTKTMIFSVAKIISYLSQFVTLEPGDIITTGTPPGVGMGIKKDGQPAPVFLKKGDVMTLGISGLGEQRQEVVAFKL